MQSMIKSQHKLLIINYNSIVKHDLKTVVDAWRALRRFSEWRGVTTIKSPVVHGEYLITLEIVEKIVVLSLDAEIRLSINFHSFNQSAPVDPSSGDTYRFVQASSKLSSDFEQAREAKINGLLQKIIDHNF